MLSLADAIIQENVAKIQQLLRFGEDVNQIDEYGFTPLIEAAIMDNVEISQILLAAGADPNGQDLTGGTALHWAAENNNLALGKLLLTHQANANAYTLAGQPVLVMPTLRQHKAFKKLLADYQADLVFTQDYINTKLLGHLYELVGTAHIVDPKNQFVEVDFEGFYLEVTLGLIAQSLDQFQNHFAARQFKRFARLVQIISGILHNACELIKFQQYRIDISHHYQKIHALITKEPLLIPVGYEGHAITFIRYGDIFVKCDRREDSRLYDNVMFYKIRNQGQMNEELIKSLLFTKQTSDFINDTLPRLLNLQPMTELKITAQISGNCSWANVEATIPALFFLILNQLDNKPQSTAHYKSLALNYFERWREWNKERSLQFCIQSFLQSDAVRKACKAEILAAILFERCNTTHASDQARLQRILEVLRGTPYEYILKNYVRVYYYQNPTEEGKQFTMLLKQHGFLL